MKAEMKLAGEAIRHLVWDDFASRPGLIGLKEPTTTLADYKGLFLNQRFTRTNTDSQQHGKRLGISTDEGSSEWEWERSAGAAEAKAPRKEKATYRSDSGSHRGTNDDQATNREEHRSAPQCIRRVFATGIRRMPHVAVHADVVVEASRRKHDGTNEQAQGIECLSGGLGIPIERAGVGMAITNCDDTCEHQAKQCEVHPSAHRRTPGNPEYSGGHNRVEQWGHNSENPGSEAGSHRAKVAGSIGAPFAFASSPDGGQHHRRIRHVPIQVVTAEARRSGKLTIVGSYHVRPCSFAVESCL